MNKHILLKTFIFSFANRLFNIVAYKIKKFEYLSTLLIFISHLLFFIALNMEYYLININKIQIK